MSEKYKLALESIEKILLESPESNTKTSCSECERLDNTISRALCIAEDVLRETISVSDSGVG